METKEQNPLLERMVRFKSMDFDSEGRLIVVGIPMALVPNFSKVFLQKLMEKGLGKKKTMELAYNWGKIHSYYTFRIVSERFGYKKTFGDKIKLLKFNIKQCGVAGLGKFEFIKIDKKSEIFIAKGNSTLAEEYKKLFGQQKEAVDHFFRGGITAFVEAVTGKEMFCVENRCIAKGHSYCEMVIKPLKEWDKENKDFKEQEVIRTISKIEEFGVKSKVI